MLPQLIKEIQIKMNHLEEDNKKLKKENKYLNDNEIVLNTSKSNHNNNIDENGSLGLNNEGNIILKKVKRYINKDFNKKQIKK